MKNFITNLKQVQLFEQINEADIEPLLKCLNSNNQSFAKGDFIVSQGDNLNGIGIILSGSVDIIKEDYFGKRTIMANLNAPDMFGEVFVCAGIKIIPVSVVASTNSQIIFIDYNRIINTCTNTCDHHSMLIQNMLKLIASKNLVLNKKIDFLLIKGLREKVATYLLERFSIKKNSTFEIPFDRSELADFLNADRSALSRELSRMKSDGLIDYQKKNFQLIDLEALEEYTNK